jgi:hypothetical protein
MLADAQVKAVAEGTVGYQAIDSKRLIDKHYASIARYALDQDPKALALDAKQQAAFESKYGVKWSTCVESSKVLNAGEAMKRMPGVNAAAFEAKWRTHGPTKLGPGLYVSKLEAEDMYVLNGFYPAQREKFTSPGANVLWFVVSWAEADLTWADFRGKVIGATDPTKAPATSIRGVILAQWKELGLASQPNMSENGVHASAGPLEGLAERVVWTGANMAYCSLGTQLLAAGVSEDEVKRLMLNPVVTIGARTAPVFDLLEDVQSTEAIKQIKEIPVTPTTGPAKVGPSAPMKPATKLPPATTARKSQQAVASVGAIPAGQLFTPEERRVLEHNQITLKIENEKYLLGHPEIHAVLSTAIKAVLKHQPEDPVAFLEDYICNNDLHAVYKEYCLRRKSEY